jgi:CheY-like chemotaxis protein
VITDIDMPGMSGPELARALTDRHPDTPVLFISGRPAPEGLADAAAGRPAAFLAKPFALSELRAAIAALAGDPGPGADRVRRPNAGQEAERAPD